LALLAKKLNKAEILDKSALTQALYLRHFGSVVSELRSTGGTKKNTEKSIIVLGGKYPTGISLINPQKPIFPRSFARLSHS
jgi:hypothetical protein